MSKRLRDLVSKRARFRCEYCHLPQKLFPAAAFHLDHILPKQHGGVDDAANRSFCCARCNLNKGPNLAGHDEVTGRLAALFHPRKQRWSRHFRWHGPTLVGQTIVGRVTVAVLGINQEDRIALRRQLIEEGTWPIYLR